ncbi:hypothetical protein L6164_018587 [Bauhinia variegata]|uniref:Uncharacterized protein n=1 Tax=Bauhinia variegata TaxID=167791 RepID=A0ACB9NF56_BAUVA|nr:hypothetical protein L6164_018587 [Bauhinia variegata]
MNDTINNPATHLPGLWRTSVTTYEARINSNSDSYEMAVLYSSRSFQFQHNNLDDWSAAQDPQRMVRDRRPSGLNTIPKPQRIHAVNGAMGSGLNPWIFGIVQQSHPRSRRQTNMQAPTEASNFRSTVLGKLKKEVFKGKQFSNKKNNAANKSEEERKEKDKDEDGKRCAVCLEDFEPKEEVMLTPCNHIFHEDCIVPWLTSNGHCPVCRFVICERERENINESGNITHAQELSSWFGDME